MKVRKVVVTLELETTSKVKDIKADLEEFLSPELKQIQVNVIKKEGK